MIPGRDESFCFLRNAHAHCGTLNSVQSVLVLVFGGEASP
jgi:hypothetical protein